MKTNRGPPRLFSLGDENYKHLHVATQVAQPRTAFIYDGGGLSAADCAGRI